MKTLLAFFFASLYGLLLRFFFAFYQDWLQVISISLIIAAPLGIGFLTVSLSGLQRVKTGAAAFFRPWLTTLILLFVTILLSLEGTICWLMIYPLFSVMAGFGGLLAYNMLRKRQRQAQHAQRDDILDDFDRSDMLKFSPVLTLPFVLGLLEQDRLLTPDTYIVSREITIAAPPASVWAAILDTQDITTQTDQGLFTWVFQLPHHLRTTLDTAAVGGRRTAYYERGLYFEETITQYEPEKLLKVAIKADPGHVPPTVLDEHIVIGGRHFKALEDTYQLTPLPNGQCRLQLSGRILINTPFNWYAGLWAKWGLSDLFQHILYRIETRATHPVQ